MPKKRDNAGVSVETHIKKEKYEELQEKLIENLIELQKVHTHMAERFDKLSEQITSLLRLFEMAAKSFASSPTSGISEKDKDFLDKIDRLLDQNKTIAKGLMLIEEKVRERMYGVASPPQMQNQMPAPNYQPNMQANIQMNSAPSNEMASSAERIIADDSPQPSVISRPLPKF